MQALETLGSRNKERVRCTRRRRQRTFGRTVGFGILRQQSKDLGVVDSSVLFEGLTLVESDIGWRDASKVSNNKELVARKVKKDQGNECIRREEASRILVNAIGAGTNLVASREWPGNERICGRKPTTLFQTEAMIGAGTTPLAPSCSHWGVEPRSHSLASEQPPEQEYILRRLEDQLGYYSSPTSRK